MANYLVTGGAGFIGSSLVEHLLGRGDSVRVVDNFLTGKTDNLAAALDRIELIEGDLCEPEIARRAVRDMDYVLHQAALPSVPRSIEEPVLSSRINVLGTVQLLAAAEQARVRRVVYAASSSAYGDQPQESKDESLTPMPLSPYAAGKLAGEFFCHAYSRSLGLETVALRYFNVFGPRQDPHSTYSAVIPLFVTAMLEGRRPTIYGDGLQSRDFTYVQNVVHANVLAATTENDVAGRAINVACGKSYSLLKLVSQINAILGTEIHAVHEEPRLGDVRHSMADIGLACSLLGYEVEVDFEEGLRKTVEWYRAGV